MNSEQIQRRLDQAEIDLAKALIEGAPAHVVSALRQWIADLRLALEMAANELPPSENSGRPGL